jgi:hypothetical protein
VSSRSAADRWQNRTEIHSESSSRVYTIAQRVGGPNAGTWGCSCPGFKGHRVVDAEGRTSCKHLKTMGLKGPLEQHHPLMETAEYLVRGTVAFSESAYRHYDTSDGFGSPEEWFRQAEEAARGRGSYRGSDEYRRSSYRRPSSTRSAPRVSSDMELLGLTEMPADVGGLKSAMRRMAFKTHPDYGGTEAGFTAMFKAYERLLRSY